MKTSLGFNCPNCGNHFPPNNTYAAGLSRVETEYLTFIAGRIVGGQPPPTIREIATALGRSSCGSVADRLSSLQKKGFLRIVKRRARAMHMTDKAWAIFAPSGTIHAP